MNKYVFSLILWMKEWCWLLNLISLMPSLITSAAGRRLVDPCTLLAFLVATSSRIFSNKNVWILVFNNRCVRLACEPTSQQHCSLILNQHRPPATTSHQPQPSEHNEYMHKRFHENVFECIPWVQVLEEKIVQKSLWRKTQVVRVRNLLKINFYTLIRIIRPPMNEYK